MPDKNPLNFVSPNLEQLRQSYKAKKSGAILEGSSRSMKTWSSVDFIVWYCTRVARAGGKTINIIKETHNSFNTTLYDDFNRRLPQWGLDAPFAKTKNVVNFKLLGNKINFLGADSDTVFSGVGSDLFWINEALDVPQAVFDQSEMRCREFWWFDYNPKTTDHWIFDKVEHREDVDFLKTTFMDNPFISKQERRKILSYDPDNPENIKQGTADDFMWKVYGLGDRAAPIGQIFKNITYISEQEFQKKASQSEQHFWGMDFGYTNSPSAIAHACIIGKDLFVDCPFYEPTESFDVLEPALEKLVDKNIEVWCDPSGDSGGRGMISSGRDKGWTLLAASTFPGSIKHGIAIIKKFRIHLVNRPHIKKEATNYKFREVQGIQLDEPVDDYNHFWDALRMALMSNIR